MHKRNTAVPAWDQVTQIIMAEGSPQSITLEKPFYQEVVALLQHQPFFSFDKALAAPAHPVANGVRILCGSAE